ncbi:ROK family protein [Sphingobium sp. CAP-1]|uniref:ROK family protein n=1 Tax=Sphingobium sp. CAP-1 TaxID=2676077 RepID=UPI0012BB3417|nr:ROK family protein [Sphingobium sp. CAP-1]QGP81011.1 ROK family protein [Sphingobium sp. CAP-1]
MKDLLIAGVELGGTKCIATLASAQGVVVEQAQFPTTTPDETLGGIEACLRRWWDDRAFAALGIASFGPVDLDERSPTFGFITSTPKPGWRDVDVARRLAAPYPVPMTFDTDVNGAAIAEGCWGGARGLRDYAYVTVGTGVGVGLIVNGHPTRGLGHCELGHIRVPRLRGDEWAGSCPYHGDCVEGLAAGPALKARKQTEHVSAVAADDPMWESVAYALAQMCHVMVLASGPHRILFGGGVIKGQRHLLPRIETMLRDSLAGYVQLADDQPFLQLSGLGDQAGPLGPIAMGLSLLGVPEPV